MTLPIPLDWGWVDEGFSPDALPTLLRQALVANGHALLQYGDPRGLITLRAQIVERLRMELDLEVPLDSVTVTNGATGALDLVARIVLMGTYDSVVLTPVFDTAIEVLKRSSRTVTQVLTEPFSDDYLSSATWEALEHALRSPTARLLYVVPTCCNPSDRTLSPAQRQRLTSLCDENDVIIVEDDPYRIYAPPAHRQHATLYAPSNPRTIFVGSFSKRLYPGLRAGYVVAHVDLTHRIVELQKYTTSSANLLAQGICSEALRSGLIDQATEYYKNALARKRAAFERAWQRHHCDSFYARWKHGTGPYLWLAVPGADLSPSAYCATLRHEGVLSVPGDIYYVNYPWSAAPEFRLSLLRVASDDIEPALRILAGVAQEVKLHRRTGSK